MRSMRSQNQNYFSNDELALVDQKFPIMANSRCKLKNNKTINFQDNNMPCANKHHKTNQIIT